MALHLVDLDQLAFRAGHHLQREVQLGPGQVLGAQERVRRRRGAEVDEDVALSRAASGNAGISCRGLLRRRRRAGESRCRAATVPPPARARRWRSAGRRGARRPRSRACTRRCAGRAARRRRRASGSRGRSPAESGSGAGCRPRAAPHASGRRSASLRAGRRRRRTRGRAGSGSASTRRRAGAGNAGRGSCRAARVIEWFTWTKRRPGCAAANASAQNSRVRLPRSSRCGAVSTSHTPAIGVACSFMRLRRCARRPRAGRRGAHRRRSARCRRGSRPRRARAASGTSDAVRSNVVAASHTGRQPSRSLALLQSSVQHPGLVRLRRAVDVAAHRRPLPGEGDDDLGDAQLAGRVRAEIPGLGIGARVGEQALAEHQVAGERLQHVLPRPGRLRIADRAPTCRSMAERTRSGTSRSSLQSPPPTTLPARAVASATPPAREEAGPIARRDDLGAGLGGAVRIVAAEGVVLAIAARALAVEIALVGGGVDHDLARSASPAPPRAGSPGR